MYALDSWESLTHSGINCFILYIVLKHLTISRGCMGLLRGHGAECKVKVSSHFLCNWDSVVLQILALQGGEQQNKSLQKNKIHTTPWPSDNILLAPKGHSQEKKNLSFHQSKPGPSGTELEVWLNFHYPKSDSWLFYCILHRGQSGIPYGYSCQYLCYLVALKHSPSTTYRSEL